MMAGKQFLTCTSGRKICQGRFSHIMKAQAGMLWEDNIDETSKNGGSL